MITSGEAIAATRHVELAIKSRCDPEYGTSALTALGSLPAGWSVAMTHAGGTVIPGNSDVIDRVRVELSSRILAHWRMRSLVHDLLVLLSEPGSSPN